MEVVIASPPSAKVLPDSLRNTGASFVVKYLSDVAEINAINTNELNGSNDKEPVKEINRYYLDGNSSMMLLHSGAY